MAHEISDERSLQAFLTDRSWEDCVSIAHRAAMRVVPTFGSLLPERWANGRDLDGLATIWSNLASSVTRMYSSPALKSATSEASRMAITYSSVGASYAAAAASSSGSDAVKYAASACGTAASARGRISRVHDAVWIGIRSDCRALEIGDDPFFLPLWVGDAPKELVDDWTSLKGTWESIGGPVWTFWIGWYENALEGRPQDWALLRDIALIPAEDWQGGPDRVHPIIEKMLIERERIRLLEQVLALTTELHEARSIMAQPIASTAVRSHNMPPELVDAESEAQRAITIIWADLEEAKAELEKPFPEPSVLKRIGHKLTGVVSAFAEYAATLGDIALRKGAEEIGSIGTRWAVRILVLYIATPPGVVQSIGTGLLELAKMLGSP